MTDRTRSRARGFTLIETLVSMVVLSLGLLGAVALLLGSVRDHAESRRETETVALLDDVADRLRANVAACAARATTTPPPCSADGLAALELAHFERAAAVLYPAGDANTSIEYAPATGVVPARYVITLRLARAADVHVPRPQVHARTLVAG